MTVMYSLLHLLVDGICALAMFGTFLSSEDGYFHILLYDFCAFALQMPFGVVLDILNMKMKHAQHLLSFFTAMLGVICTIAGAMTHPIVLGIGNALFHIGGGMGTIHEGRIKNDRGRRLGIFVAPGAFGLYLGTLAAKSSMQKEVLLTVSMIMLVICGAAAYRQKKLAADFTALRQKEGDWDRMDTSGIFLAVCCFAVVILRSYIGMMVSFPWKTGILPGIGAVAAIVCGKMAGGFCGAQWGYKKTAVLSLSLAVVCYFFSSYLPMGIAALFLFNMTMPITLYLMICRFPRMPGFAFGCLTFALFLGFLPGYFGYNPVTDGRITGCVGSVISLFFLLAGIYMGGVHGHLSD